MAFDDFEDDDFFSDVTDPHEPRQTNAKNPFVRIPQIKEGQVWACSHCGEICNLVAKEEDYSVTYNPKTGETVRLSETVYVSSCHDNDVTLYSDKSDDAYEVHVPKCFQIQQDQLYEKVKESVIRTQKVSTSAIQRKFRIFFQRASNIIDELEYNGVISHMYPNGRRDVLIENPKNIPEGATHRSIIGQRYFRQDAANLIGKAELWQRGWKTSAVYTNINLNDSRIFKKLNGS